jgi:uncharacterized coiled-coil protein SlyX
VEVADGQARLYPGTYSEFLWSKENAGARKSVSAAPSKPSTPMPSATATSYEDRKRETAQQRRREKALRSLRDRIDDLESRIADREKAIKELEAAMSAPGFYDDHTKAKPVLDQHQALMWEVGDLLNQWEMLQGEATAAVDVNS